MDKCWDEMAKLISQPKSPPNAVDAMISSLSMDFGVEMANAAAAMNKACIQATIAGLRCGINGAETMLKCGPLSAGSKRAVTLETDGNDFDSDRDSAANIVMVCSNCRPAIATPLKNERESKSIAVVYPVSKSSSITANDDGATRSSTNSSKTEIKVDELPPGKISQETIPVAQQTLPDGVVRVEGTNIYYFRDKLELGFGATSIVYEGYHMCPQRPAAVKKFREDCNDVYEKELKVWLALTKDQTSENLNIVQLFEYIPIKDDTRKLTNYFLAMEMAKCDLNTRLEQLQNEPGNHYERLVGYIQDVGNALKFLHGQQHKIIHRDVKPRNILLFGYDPDGNGNEREIAKLADFGVSRMLSYTISATNSVATGTLNWMAPEALNALLDDELFENTCGMDIFSFGMTCHFTMSLGKQHPFDTGRASISKNIRTPSLKPLKLPVDVPNYVCANHLFGWMMSKAENEGERPMRPNSGQVLHHPFFWSQHKTFSFLRDLMLFLKTKDVGNHIRRKIDENFLQNYCFLDHTVEPNGNKFDWTTVLGEKFFNICRCTNPDPGQQSIKPYDGASLVSFVNLILDTTSQYDNLVEELIQSGDTLGAQLSSSRGVPSREKFCCYLLNKIPGGLVCLYSTLMEMNNPCDESLKDYYYFS